MSNPFSRGQEVLCISESFPIMPHCQGDNPLIGSQAPKHPKMLEQLVVSEILGAYIRFDKYDTPEDVNWWHFTRFAPLLRADSATFVEELTAIMQL